MIGISTHSASSANVDSLYTTMLNSLTSHKSRGGLFVEGHPLWPILDSLAATYQFAGVAELHVPTAVARSARVDLVNAGITSLELVPGEGAVSQNPKWQRHSAQYWLPWVFLLCPWGCCNCCLR